MKKSTEHILLVGGGANLEIADVHRQLDEFTVPDSDALPENARAIRGKRFVRCTTVSRTGLAVFRCAE